eukprot:7282106-Pyramimonas_sp.AAC.1
MNAMYCIRCLLGTCWRRCWLVCAASPASTAALFTRASASTSRARRRSVTIVSRLRVSTSVQRDYCVTPAGLYECAA